MYHRQPPYNDTLAGIKTALSVNAGIIKLTGKMGTGKTALCNMLCRDLEAAGQRVVFFRHPPKTAEQMQRSILWCLQLDTSGNFTRQLTARLKARQASSRPLVLIFDDAQDIDKTIFMSIRKLRNIQNDSQALINIIVCGTEALDKKLSAASFRAFTRFLGQSFTLAPMTLEQLGDFCSAYCLDQSMPATPLTDENLFSLLKETGGLPGAVPGRLKPEPGAAAWTHPVIPHQAAAVAKTGTTAWLRKAALIMPGVVLLAGAGVMAYRFPDDEPAIPAISIPVAPVVAAQTVAAEIILSPDMPAVPDITQDNAAEPEAPSVEVASTVATVEEVSGTNIVEPAAPSVEVTSTTTMIDEVSGADAMVASATSEAVADTVDASVGGQAGSIEGTVDDFLASWADSWQSQDVEAYLRHYHLDFTPIHADSVAEWRSQRQATITRADDIVLGITSLERLGGDAMVQTIRFWLSYRSANYADDTFKELILQQQDGQWRIRAENNLQINRL